MPVYAIVGHFMFSFMNGFSGYNQIRMDSSDVEMVMFRTPMGNFHYMVMPFGLKNVDSTYQQAMTTIFHDMLHDSLEDYVDHIVLKSKEKHQHVKNLRNVFITYRRDNLWMNPLKCAFSVSSGKFLRFTILQKGDNLTLSKPKLSKVWGHLLMKIHPNLVSAPRTHSINSSKRTHH